MKTKLLTFFSMFLTLMLTGFLGVICNQTTPAQAYEKTFRNSNIDYGNYCEHKFPEHLTSAMGVESTGFFRVDNVTDYTGAKDQLLNRDETPDTGGSVLVEHFDSSFKYLSQTWIKRELPKYGGFFQGKDAYYFFFGKNNPKQDDDAEVWRIVKYDRSWNRVGSASLTGGQTSVWDSIANPNADFYEYGNYLYINTNLEGYADMGGDHHQWSYLIVIDTSTMTVVRHGDMQSVSHSLRQFVLRDREGRLIVYEQCDGYPERGAVLVRFKTPDIDRDNIGGRTGLPDSSVGTTDVVNTWYYGFNEESREERDASGNNETHATIGGFVETEKNYITAGSSTYQKHDESLSTPIHNAYITITPKDDFTEDATKMVWLTSYEEKKGVFDMAGTPYIVKLTDNRILVIWSADIGLSDVRHNLQYVFIDGDGNLLSEVKTVEGQLSDCKPVVSSITGETKVNWVVNTDVDVVLYSLTSDGKLSSKKATGYPASMHVFPKKLTNKLDIYCNYIGDIPSGYGDIDLEEMYKNKFTIYDPTFPGGTKALVFAKDFDTTGYKSKKSDGIWKNVGFKVKGFDPYYYGNHTYESRTIEKIIRVEHIFYSAHSCDVKWYDYCDGAMEYTLYRRIGNGAYKKIKTFKNKGKKRYWKYIDKGVKRSQKVSYRIIAYTKTKSGKKIHTSDKNPGPDLPHLNLGKELRELKSSFSCKIKVTNNIWKKKVHFYTSDKKVAKVSSTGKVTAVGEGTAIITAKAGGQVGYTTIKVTKLDMLPGQEKALKSFIKKANANGATLETDIDNKDYYRFDDDGYLIYMVIYDGGYVGKLDVGAFPRLEELHCFNNPDLTDVDVSKNSKLKHLRIEESSVKNIDVSKNKSLNYLGLASSPIESLDISGNTELKQIYLDTLTMKTVDISKNTKLDAIMLHNMEMDGLDPARYPELEILTLENCGLKGTLNLAGLIKLKQININNAKDLTGLITKSCPALERILLKKSGVTELDLTGCIGLKTLKSDDLYGTDLKRIICSGCSSLEEFTYGSKILEEIDLTGCTGLGKFAPGACKIKSIDLHDCHNLTYLGLSALKGGVITTGEYTGEITKIDLSTCTSLEEVYLSGNHISSLDLTGLKNLKRLQMINCGLESITFDPAGHEWLTILETHQNNFKEFIAPKLPRLKTVSLLGCDQLTAIDLSGSPNLERLSTNPAGQPIKSIILNSAIKNAEKSPLTTHNMDSIITYK